MGTALIVLAALILGQWWLIYKLLDRLLVQAKIPSLQPVPYHGRDNSPGPVIEPRRPRFTVPIPE